MTSALSNPTSGNRLLQGVRACLSGLAATAAILAGLGVAPTQAHAQLPTTVATIAVRGGWAVVINTTPRWMVIQNQQGKQFPIAFDSIRQFVVRWPSSVTEIPPTALVETTGIDLGSNQVLSEHIDFFDGAARLLVSPTYLRVMGDNRVLSPLDLMTLSPTNTGMPIMPGEDRIPQRQHVVGPLVSAVPLRLGTFGNVNVSVMPSPNGLSVTQVTLGSPSMVKKGDYVYVTPLAMAPRSLNVGQLLLYKQVPLRLFVP